jgi:hypothetical protein
MMNQIEIREKRTEADILLMLRASLYGLTLSLIDLILEVTAQALQTLGEGGNRQKSVGLRLPSDPSPARKIIYVKQNAYRCLASGGNPGRGYAGRPC